MKKKILLVLGGILVLSCGIILIPKNNNNKINNETEINLADLETNPDLNNNNTFTFVADKEDVNLTQKEIIDKYKNNISVLEETESIEINNIDTKEFKEDLNVLGEVAETEIAEQETEPVINLENIEVNNIQDNFTSSTSENIVPVVASPIPETTPEPQTEPETTIAIENIDYTEMVWNNTKEEREEIYKKGKELIQVANAQGLNTSGLSTVLYVLDNRAYYEPDGTIPFIEITKDYSNNCYNVDIYVSVNPEKSELNNTALKELCKLISFNNDNVFNCIMNDYLNNVYANADTWYDTDYNFKIMGHLENGLVRYSIKY